MIPRPRDARPGAPAPWSHLATDERRVTLADLRARLADAPAPRLSPLEGSGARGSAVLAPIYEDDDGELHIVLTRRASHLRSHSGEVSFPGGGQDEGETFLETALREAFEEVALTDPVEPLGELDHLQTITSRGFIVPFVGLLPGRPILTASPDEVAHILHVSFAELLLDEVYREEWWLLPPGERPLYFFELVGDTVWGATGNMLHNLLSLATGTYRR